MEREELENKLIDFIDGRLSTEDAKAVEALIACDPSVRQLHDQLREVIQAMNASPELEPGRSMKDQFEKLLAQEMKPKGTTRTVFFSPVMYRAAAAVLLVAAAFAAGYWIQLDRSREKELQSLRKEVESTKQMMLVMLQNQQSASQRIQGVNVSFGMTAADDEVVRALVKALNEDPNTNVRMAALDALGRFYQEPRVRSALIASLNIQKDPVVQIALIEWLVKMKEKGVVTDLEKIVKDNEQMKAVKDAAYSGLLKLS